MSVSSKVYFVGPRVLSALDLVFLDLLTLGVFKGGVLPVFGDVISDNCRYFPGPLERRPVGVSWPPSCSFSKFVLIRVVSA